MAAKRQFAEDANRVTEKKEESACIDEMLAFLVARYPMQLKSAAGTLPSTVCKNTLFR
jgi:hypothetical protein